MQRKKKRGKERKIEGFFIKGSYRREKEEEKFTNSQIHKFTNSQKERRKAETLRLLESEEVKKIKGS